MTNDKFCINYERVLDNGAGLVLQQCLFDVAQAVLFGNQTLTVPQDHIKVRNLHQFHFFLDYFTSKMF